MQLLDRVAAPLPRAGAALGHPLAKLALGGLAVLVLLLVGYRFGDGLDLGPRGGTISANDATCAQRGCDIHLTATLANRAYAERLGIWEEIEPRMRMSQAFVLAATAHAGAVRGLSLDGKVFLKVDGVLYPASDRPVALATHHNTYLTFFPRYDMQGQPIFERSEGQLEVLVNGVEGPGDNRTLTFNYPLPGVSGDLEMPIAQVLMTIGAAMAALLFACTPCLVGSLTLGSLTTGTVASLAGKEAAAKVRSRLVKQTLSYLAALVVLYIAIAVAVNVFDLQTSDLRPMELLGGLVLLGIGALLVRGTAQGAWVEGKVWGVVGRVAPGFAGRRSGAAEAGLSPRTSSAMGASLAMVCSVAGAPTLTTAILLPLLVYAGLSSPAWAIVVIAVYLLVCAVPFFFVAVGWGEFLMNASMRLRNALLVASALLLVAMGILLVFSPETVANAISTPARLVLKPLQWLS
ncbi:MAG: hypothetical protein HY681_06770 [Chloroflexi bacterium]|nr:hypothetical protein [Chloroflexota bacterium]